MKSRGWSLAVVGLCLGAILLVILGQFRSPTTMQFGQDAFEEENNLAETHEANGPDGSSGLPMQRLPPKGIGLAAALLLASGGLAVMQKRNH
jgi:hypothetical protein